MQLFITSLQYWKSLYRIKASSSWVQINEENIVKAYSAVIRTEKEKEGFLLAPIYLMMI